MLPRGLGQLRPRGHARHFLRALLALDPPDRSLCPPRCLALLDQVVMIGKGCDLRQVGAPQPLFLFQPPLHSLPPPPPPPPADPSINFVEYQRPLRRRRLPFARRIRP